MTIYSLPFTMVTTFFVSYLYELVGRKITIFMSFFLTSILFVILPYTAPNLNNLILVRCLIGVTMAAPLSHPLVPDYVKRSSRGRAIALSGIGFVMGEVFSMGVLFNLTKSMSYKKAFLIAAGVTMCFAIFLLVAVKDPDLRNIRTNVSSKHSNLAE